MATLSQRIKAVEAARLADRLATTDRAAAQLPAGFTHNNCSCCRSSQQQAADSRAARRQRLAAADPTAGRLLAAAGAWAAAVTGCLAVMLLGSINF
jgi:hypothetical protein